LVAGYAPPSKTTRNYPTSGVDIDIAIVAIPVIDVETIISIPITDIGNVRTEAL